MVANTQGDLSVNKIKRAPPLRFTIIPCIDCDAGVGEQCLSSTGAYMPKGHISRRRLALRKIYGEKESDGLSSDAAETPV